MLYGQEEGGMNADQGGSSSTTLNKAIGKSPSSSSPIQVPMSTLQQQQQPQQQPQQQQQQQVNQLKPTNEILTDIDNNVTIEKRREHVRRVLFSKILENKGSTARDHLANERTYLAWVRTGLSAIALGVALAKIGSSKVGGIVFVVLGTIFLLYSPVRYFQVYKQLLKGKFAPNRVGTIIFILLGIAAAVTALVVVLAS
ncbi:hypothetical protein SAMD00019534_006070, partial [Acytostelium subglobosum LB1]|uniref:hypothetical protein n=1 Tax=Acytostelium subglobosum LB1 TaxID=1410327 RepID=UPI0006449B09